MSKRILTLSTLFGPVLLAQLGCGHKSWQPPPPYGTTYQYDYQGFQASDTTVVGGTYGGFPAYGAAFHFRSDQGVHDEAGGKDPFGQSAPINGVQFNPHLEGQGAKLGPTSGATAPASAPAPTRPQAMPTHLAPPQPQAAPQASEDE